MANDQILCISQRIPLIYEWRNKLRQQFEHVTEIPMGNTLDAHTLSVYRLIIVDVPAATCQAVDLCRQLRADFSGPILAVVPPAGENYLLALYRAGVDECIPQSIAPNLLVAKITRWLLWSRSDHDQPSQRPPRT